MHSLTAAALSTGQHRIQHRTTSVRVDFDQTETVLVQMEVIAEEHALGATGAGPRNGGDIRQDLLPVGRECHHCLDGLHDAGHSFERRPRHEDRLRSKQVGASVAH